ncbi:MAG: OmpA family protein [Treponema sp.]|nr:OmpA family protein [Treponema sp.]
MSKLAFLLFLPVSLLAQQNAGEAAFKNSAPGPFSMVERSDWSRYDNGKYTGHVYREVRASINPVYPEGKGIALYRGNFLLLEETLRDMRQSARAVDDVIPVSFRVFPDGQMEIEEDNGLPALRGFPAFPAGVIRPGARWKAPGIRMADPLNEGKADALLFLAEYEYHGTETYKEIPVHRVSAKYAVRLPTGSRLFSRVQGSHTVEILLRVEDSLPFMMRDILDETYTFTDGTTLRFRGFTFTFNDSRIPLNRETIIPEVEKKLHIPPEKFEKNIEVVSVPEGIKLTVKDIRFVPDSAEFLPEEKDRLDSIAAALQTAPQKSFLVEGHTASVGRPEGEIQLSVERAKRMVDEMVKRGIPEERFFYKGWGGKKPLADNSTEEGRRLNRRVEITILD